VRAQRRGFAGLEGTKPIERVEKEGEIYTEGDAGI